MVRTGPETPTTPNQMTAVEGAVGALLVFAIILLIIAIWLTAVVHRKENDGSGQSNKQVVQT